MMVRQKSAVSTFPAAPLPSSTSSYRNTQNSASSTLPIFGDDGNTSTKGGLSILRLYKKKNISVIVSV